jgi:hypothetical protein
VRQFFFEYVFDEFLGRAVTGLLGDARGPLAEDPIQFHGCS